MTESPVDIKQIADELLEATPDFEQAGGRVRSHSGPLKKLSVQQVKPNIVVFYQPSETFIKPAGWIMVYFMDSEQAAADIKAGKIDYPLFMPGSLMQRSSGYDIMTNLWQRHKAPPRETPEQRQSRAEKRHVVGALEAYKRKDSIFIDYISVRPGWKRNTIGTKMIQALEKEFPGTPIQHSPTTDQGYGFLKKTGYLKHNKSSWGGERHVEKTAESIVQAMLEDDADEWIGVDLDGTLAKHLPGKYRPTKIGDPIPKMVARIRRWVGHGKKVKIFTARADDEVAVNAIKKWLKDNELPNLEITNVKDQNMTELWDDRAIGIQKNTGEVKEERHLSRQALNAVIERLLDESPEIKTLKNNQIKLDPDEREQVMKAGAVWHMGKDGGPSPAVRKAVVKGKTWYWCATHRCGQVRPTLKGAIKTFDFVKTTA